MTYYQECRIGIDNLAGIGKKLGDTDSDPMLSQHCTDETKLNIRLGYSTLVYYSTLFNSTSRCFLLPCSHRTCSVTVILGALTIQSVKESGWGILSIRLENIVVVLEKKLSKPW